MFVMDFMGPAYGCKIGVVGLPEYLKSLMNKNIVN
jgi:hypothetical protein